MKQIKNVIFALTLLSVVITVVLLPFMHDRIPVHYNAAGEITRLGSKYESLILPVATILMGAFFLLIEKFIKKTVNDKKEKRLVDTIFAICAVVTMLLFLGMNIFFMVKAIQYGL